MGHMKFFSLLVCKRKRKNYGVVDTCEAIWAWPFFFYDITKFYEPATNDKKALTDD